MKSSRIITIGALLAISAGALAQNELQATYQDIQRTFGFVPTFLKAVPPAALPGAWQDMKSIELSPNTMLPPRTKELIGLAVAAQIPCQYCIYFHTQGALVAGDTAEQLAEATEISALTRTWGAVTEGAQLDPARMRQEVAAMVGYVAQHRQQRPQPIAVTDAASAYKDIAQTYGMVPSFLRAYPREGIAGAWREFKAIALNPNTALDAKTKDLISLGVAAQMPCTACVVFSTELARHDGAAPEEIQEAVAMAGITRHWSALLNGSQMDVNQFRREVDRITQRERQMRRSASR